MNICTLTDCEMKYEAKGYCTKHYQQVRKYGHIVTAEEKKVHMKKEKGVCLNDGSTHFKKGQKSWNAGLKDWLSDEHKAAVKAANTGRPGWNKGLYGYNSGDKNGNWKGGVHTINNALRRTKQYKNWRTAVFERDDYTCQFCNVKGGILNADHIKPFAFFPELRFEMTNGRTLCLDCHKTTPTYKRHKYIEETI